MISKLLKVVVVASVAASLGCDINPSVDLSASPRAVEFEPSPEGFCANGGTTIKVGDDHDRSGSLEGVEIIDVTIICDGTDGADGVDGVSGSDGTDGTDGTDGKDGTDGLTPRVNSQAIPPGAICPMGGVLYEVGYDNGAGGEIAQDGLMGRGEVISSQQICHGEDGRDGATPMVRLVEVPPGPACPFGGSRLDIGNDNGAGGALSGDGALAPSEIVESTFICDGGVHEPHNSLVSSEAAENCEFGGVTFHTGLDLNDDSQLGEDEILQHTTICFDGQESSTIVSDTVRLIDARGTLLGDVLASTGESILVRTPTNYLIEYDWNGSFGSSSLYFSDHDCAGDSFWLQAAAPGREIDDSILVYSPSLDSMVTPDGIDGIATSVGGIVASSLYAWDSCVAPPQTMDGWQMSRVAWQATGVPQQIVLPLDIR